MPHLGLTLRQDVAEALMLLTRLPVPRAAAGPRGAASAWAWPLVGGLVGLLAAALGALALWGGLSPGFAAALALAAQALLTAGLHEDGLADCADGFWGGRTRERRLEIMRDSRLGSYGALALMLVTLLRWSAVSGLMAAGWVWGPLLAVGALGRWPMAAILAALPSARPGGLAASTGRPGPRTLILGGLVALALAALGVGWSGLGAALGVLVTTAAWGRVARAKIGGQTGDVCGAAQQLAEVAALAVLLGLLT